MVGPSFSRDRCTQSGCAWNHRSDGMNLRNHIRFQHGGAKPLGCGIIAQSHHGWMRNHLVVCNSCRNNDESVLESIEESMENETVQSSSGGTDRETGRSASIASSASSTSSTSSTSGNSGTSGTEGRSINNSFNNFTVQGNFSRSMTINLRRRPSTLSGQI